MINKKNQVLVILLITTVVLFFSFKANTDNVLKSPNGKISVIFKITGSRALYSINIAGEEIISDSRLGIIMEGEDFYDNLSLISSSNVKPVTDIYELIADKRTKCEYKGNEQIFHLKNKKGSKMDIIFRVSDDGVAFSYLFPGKSNDLKKITEEKTSFKFSSGAKAWLHPHADAWTGWEHSQPSYEEYYSINIPVGTPAPQKAGWSFPALFKTKNSWVLITESGVTPTYCGSRLDQNSPEGEYSIAFPQPMERVSDQAAYLPEAKLPWQTPWRILMIGSLADIVESTLVTDLALPAVVENTSFVKPGKSSWSWAILKDDYTVFDVQKMFIDYAAQMEWEYCLVDADWHKKIGYEKIKELIDYAAQKNIGILLWYNSAGSWNTTPYGPRNLMFDPETRRAEFEKISKMGAKGVKVDFWGGDGQSMIQYYYDLFADAAKYGLTVNCHGTTVTRGWSRTFPNLVTMESVRGFEFITFEQANADEAVTHCSVLPFTRNVVGPMDFTPMCLTDIPNIRRRTGNGFELALSVLFQSGIQHYAEIPIGMAIQPDYVKKFLKEMPEKWDDIKFIDGFPGEYVVLARKAGDKWYVAGINSTANAKPVEVDLSFATAGDKVIIITEGEHPRQLVTKDIKVNNGKAVIEIKSNGGFVLQL